MSHLIGPITKSSLTVLMHHTLLPQIVSRIILLTYQVGSILTETNCMYATEGEQRLFTIFGYFGEKSMKAIQRYLGKYNGLRYGHLCYVCSITRQWSIHTHGDTQYIESCSI